VNLHEIDHELDEQTSMICIYGSITASIMDLKKKKLLMPTSPGAVASRPCGSCDLIGYLRHPFFVGIPSQSPTE